MTGRIDDEPTVVIRRKGENEETLVFTNFSRQVEIPQVHSLFDSFELRFFYRDKKGGNIESRIEELRIF